MPHQHSELANWDGSVSRPRVRQPFPAVAHTPAQSQAQFQESPANPHQRNAFSSSSHMSSDDSATDIARTEQMLLARISSEDMAISSINESDVGKRQNPKNPNTDLVSNTRTHSDPTNLHGTRPNGKPAGNTALSPSSLENSALPNHSMLLEISSSEHDLILKESMATSGDLRAQRPAQVASEASISIEPLGYPTSPRSVEDGEGEGLDIHPVCIITGGQSPSKSDTLGPILSGISSNLFHPTPSEPSPLAQATAGSGMFSRLAQDSSRSPSVTNHFHDTIIEISSELSPEIPVYSLPPSSDPFDSDIQILNSPPRLSKRTVRPQRRPYVLVPSLPTGLAKEEYIANTSALSGGAKNARLLSSNTLSPGTRRIALGLRPNRKRKGPEDAITPSPRKRARRQPQEEHKASRTVIGFSTEPVVGFVGEDELDTLLGVHPIEIGEEIPYEDAGKWAVQALWISLKHATGRTDSRYETSRQAWPVKSPPATSKSGYSSIQPGSQSDSRPTRNPNTHNPHSPSPKKKPQPKPHRQRQQTQTSIPPSQPSSSSLPQPTGFVISNEYIAAVQHYSSSLPRSPTPPNLGPTSFGSDHHEPSTSISPDQHPGIFDVLNVSNSTDERNARNDNARNSPLVDKAHHSPMLDANQSELGSVFQENGYNTHSFQSIFNIVPWSASLRTMESQQFEQPAAGPSSGPSTIYKNHAEVPHMDGFGNGTIDPSVLGGAPMLISGRTPSLSPSPPPGDQSLNSLPTRHASTSTYISTDLDRTTVSRSPALSSNRPLAKSKGKNKTKPSEELLATVSSMKRRSVDRNSTGGEKRDRKPSTRIREALQQVDYELTDEDADADGETDDEDFEPLVSLPSTRRETPPTQGQPKPSRKSISTLKGSKASRKSVEEYCHQCRNKPKMLKVRCSGTRPDGVPCGLYFCERCITRRYPEIEFNAFDEDFICPKCDDFCNCTVCCRRRGEEYISSRGVGPSPFLQNSQNASASTQPRNPSSLSKPYPMTDRNPPVTPALAVPPGMFWGTVYDIDGKRIGAGVVSEDRQVIVTNDPLPPRKIIYVGKPPPRKGGPLSSTTDAAEKPAHNVGLQNRAYIGSKPPMLNHSLYKSLEEHFALLTRERSSSPLTPVHSSDPVQPTTVDGFLLAQAIQEMAKKTE